MRSTISVAILSFASIICAAQTDSCKDRETIVHGIREADGAAIDCAVRSGDASLVPILETEYLDLKAARQHGDAVYLQTALSRLGSQREIKEMVCEVNYGQAHVRWNAALRLEVLGGWLAIHTFAKFLEERPEYTRNSGSEGDLIFPSMQVIAVRHLAKLAKDGPGDLTGLQVNAGISSPKVSEWRNWLATHEAELKSLKPNEVISLTHGECEQVLKHDPVAIINKSKTVITY
jgi:hypothetical protein